MKNQGTIVVMATVAAACILYGMLKANNLAFITGLAFGIPTYLLFRKRYKEQIRERYGAEHNPGPRNNTPKGGEGERKG